MSNRKPMAKEKKEGGGNSTAPLLNIQSQYIIPSPKKRQHRHFKVTFFDVQNVGHVFKITAEPKRALVFLQERGKKGATLFEAIRDENFLSFAKHIDTFKKHGLIIEREWVKNRRDGRSKCARYFLLTDVEIVEIGGQK